MSHDVIIIEDEMLIALDLQAMCEGLGHRVLALAATVSEAKERIERLNPSSVLSDLDLRGDGDGVDVAVEVRRRFRQYSAETSRIGAPGRNPCEAGLEGCSQRRSIDRAPRPSRWASTT